MDDGLVGIDGPAAADLLPRPAELRAPGTGVGGRISHEPAGVARAQHQSVLPDVGEVLLPLAVVVRHDQGHAAILNGLGHLALLF